MRSVTSFFNPGLMRKNFTRTWPLFAVYALVWTFCLPVVLGSQLPYYNARYNTTGLSGSTQIQRNILELTSDMVPWITLFFGLLAAMAMFSYLMQSRSTGGLHSLPISRRSLFLTNYLSGLAFTVGCHLLVVLLTLAVLLLHGALCGDVLLALLSWLAVSSLEFLCFYSFAVFTLMLSGQFLAVPVLYAVFNILVPGIEIMLRTISSMLLYGFYDGSLLGIGRIFCPFYMFYYHTDYIDTSRYTAVGTEYGPVLFEGWITVLIYAAVGLLLALAAWLIYRRRPSEHTGDTIAVNWAKPLFKYGAAFCFALTLGQLFYMLFFPNRLEYYNYSPVGLILCLTAAAVLAYFAAEMLLQKSFRVFRKSLPGVLGIALVIAVLGWGLTLDITGYENFLPEAEDVEQLYLSGRYLEHFGGDLTESEDIYLAVQLHEALIREKAQQTSRARVYRNGPYDPQRDEYLYANLHLRYDLGNGSRTERSYSLYLKEEDLARKDSVYSRLLQLCDSRSIQLLMLFGSDQAPDPSLFTGGYMSWPVLESAATEEELAKYGPEYDPGIHVVYHDMNLDVSQARQLFDAILLDLQENHFGSAALLQAQQAAESGDPEANLHNLSVEFHCRRNPVQTETTAALPSASAVEVTYAGSEQIYSLHLRIPYSATHTIAAAQQLTGGRLYG